MILLILEEEDREICTLVMGMAGVVITTLFYFVFYNFNNIREGGCQRGISVAIELVVVNNGVGRDPVIVAVVRDVIDIRGEVFGIVGDLIVVRCGY